MVAMFFLFKGFSTTKKPNYPSSNDSSIKHSQNYLHFLKCMDIIVIIVMFLLWKRLRKR